MDLVRGSLADCRKSIVGLPKAQAHAHTHKKSPSKPSPMHNARPTSPLRLEYPAPENIELTNLQM
jgi:hypothetical protein